MAESVERRGVCGFHLGDLGADDATELQVVAPAHWPVLNVVTRVGSVEAGQNWIEDSGARIFGEASTSSLLREPLSVELTVGRRHSAGEILQPFLAAAIVVASRWLGRQAFHAGGFVAAGGDVVAVLGAKGAGKSTILAMLAGAGARVTGDDLLVLDDGVVLTGPRCIDLRGDAALHLEVGSPLGAVGARERWRMELSSIEPELPLGGWVLPEWGDRFEIVPVPLTYRLPLLLRHLAVVAVPPSPQDLLHLAALPCWRLVRPPRWDVVDELTSALMALPTRSAR